MPVLPAGAFSLAMFCGGSDFILGRYLPRCLLIALCESHISHSYLHWFLWWKHHGSIFWWHLNCQLNIYLFFHWRPWTVLGQISCTVLGSLWVFWRWCPNFLGPWLKWDLKYLWEYFFIQFHLAFLTVFWSIFLLIFRLFFASTEPVWLKVSCALLRRCICSSSSVSLLTNQSDLAAVSTSAHSLQLLKRRFQIQVSTSLVIEILLKLDY